MKGLQITFFIIFASILTTQAIRHVHLYAYGAEESVAAPLEDFYGFQKEIRLEASTADLEIEYEQSKDRIKQLRDADSTKPLHQLRQENSELFARNNALAQELRERDGRVRELRDVWMFSIAGYVLIGLGLLLYARGYDWTGISLILPGFLELSWWSSPAFSLGGAIREYELLLLNKIVLTAIALALLYSIWVMAQRKGKNSQ